MNNLSLSKEINSPPAIVKEILWQFVRGDMSTRNFELWVYSNDENILSITFGDDSYLELIILDYRDEREINELKTAIYEFLIQFPDQCLCYTFSNNTLLYPFSDSKNEKIFLQKQIDLLKTKISIKDFSGMPPIYKSRWYHPGELSCCLECKTWWFVVFEESEGSDYYLIRLNEEDALLISQFQNWPNDHWPSNLKNWNSFLNLKFQSWTNIYVKKQKIVNSTNFLMNYDLNTSKYR